MEKSQIKKWLKCLIWGILLVGIPIASYYFFVEYTPYYFSRYFPKLTASERVLAEKDFRFLGAQVIAGILASIGLYFTYKRTKALDDQNRNYVKQRKQDRMRFKKEFKYTETRLELEKNKAHDELLLQQYTKASELLASDNISSRLSGIYLFEKIMNGNREYYYQIIELLTAFVRDKRNIEKYWVSKLEPDNPNYYTLSNTNIQSNSFKRFRKEPVEKDIQAIITVLGRRNKEYNINDMYINLENTNLYSIIFSPGMLLLNDQSLSFSKFRFNNTILVDANLNQSYFEGSIFIDTFLENTNLMQGNFTECLFMASYFYNSNCKGAIFNSANIISCVLDRANNLSYEQLVKAANLFATRYKNCKLWDKLVLEKQELFINPFTEEVTEETNLLKEDKQERGYHDDFFTDVGNGIFSEMDDPF